MAIIVDTVLSASQPRRLRRHGAKKTEPPTVEGRWTGRITGTPHGDMAMSLSLKQDGNKVTGTLTTSTRVNWRSKAS